MKKILILFSILLFAVEIKAQQIKETVYLKNGSVIKGEIVEQIPNVSIKVKTADGSIFVYQMSEVQKITKDEVKKNSTNERHKGLDFNVNLGYNMGVGDAKNLTYLPVEIGLGKQVNKNLYLGGSTGVWLSTTDGTKPFIPIAFDSKLMYPGSSSSIIPFAALRLGYMLNLNKMEVEAQEIPDGMGGSITTEAKSERLPDAIMMQIMPGVQIPLSKGRDFLLSAGYTHLFSTKSGGSTGYFSVKAGFNFYKDPTRSPRKRKRRLPVPTREKGLQFTLEGGMNFSDFIGGGGDLICTYKLNPHFSIGMGAGYEKMSPFDNEGEVVQTILMVGNEMYSSTKALNGKMSSIKTYVRGVYRMFDKRFSPIVSCDAGMRFYSFDEKVYGQDMINSWGNIPMSEIFGDPESNGFFIAPAIGISLRTTNNSYIELKGGYSFAKNILGGKTHIEKQGHDVYASCKPIKASVPFISIGFTHTFGKRGAKM